MDTTTADRKPLQFTGAWHWDDQQHRWCLGRSTRADDNKRCDAYFKALHDAEDDRLATTGYTRANAPQTLLRALTAGEDLAQWRKPPTPPEMAARGRRVVATRKSNAKSPRNAIPEPA